MQNQGMLECGRLLGYVHPVRKGGALRIVEVSILRKISCVIETEW